MPRKEFVRLMEESIWALDRLAGRTRMKYAKKNLLPRQQMTVLVRLYEKPARLKDIAAREGLSTPNLCATFRKLERDGLVERTVDANDRRNTWYKCTPTGNKMAESAIENFREQLDGMFVGISNDDEQKLLAALKNMGEVLKNMELKK